MKFYIISLVSLLANLSEAQLMTETARGRWGANFLVQAADLRASETTKSDDLVDSGSGVQLELQVNYRFNENLGIESEVVGASAGMMFLQPRGRFLRTNKLPSNFSLFYSLGGAYLSFQPRGDFDFGFRRAIVPMLGIGGQISSFALFAELGPAMNIANKSSQNIFSRIHLHYLVVKMKSSLLSVVVESSNLSFYSSETGQTFKFSDNSLGLNLGY